MIPTKKQHLMDARKEMFDRMEQQLTAGRTPEDSLFYYHPHPKTASSYPMPCFG